MIDSRLPPANMMTDEYLYMNYIQTKCSDILDTNALHLPCQTTRASVVLVTGVVMSACEIDCERNGTVTEQVKFIYLMEQVSISGMAIPDIMPQPQPPLLPGLASSNSTTTTTTSKASTAQYFFSATNATQRTVNHEDHISLQLAHHSKHVKYALEASHILSGCLCSAVGGLAKAFR